MGERVSQRIRKRRDLNVVIDSAIFIKVYVVRGRFFRI